jgi:hypothetical protein
MAKWSDSHLERLAVALADAAVEVRAIIVKNAFDFTAGQLAALTADSTSLTLMAATLPKLAADTPVEDGEFDDLRSALAAARSRLIELGAAAAVAPAAAGAAAAAANNQNLAANRDKALLLVDKAVRFGTAFIGGDALRVGAALRDLQLATAPG